MTGISRMKRSQLRFQVGRASGYERYGDYFRPRRRGPPAVMIFTSFEFLCFFVAVILLRSCLRGLSAEKWLLLAASYCFYLTWSVPCIVLLIFTSLSDYYIGRKLGQTENPIYRKRLLVCSLV